MEGEYTAQCCRSASAKKSRAKENVNFSITVSFRGHYLAIYLFPADGLPSGGASGTHTPRPDEKLRDLIKRLDPFS